LTAATLLGSVPPFFEDVACIGGHSRSLGWDKSVLIPACSNLCDRFSNLGISVDSSGLTNCSAH
jgi:hypothetical protein